MVNDKMVNGFMTKKQYIFPLVEIVSYQTELLSITGAGSPPPDNFMGAPARRPGSNTEVF
jgi:hypothetical protein